MYQEEILKHFNNKKIKIENVFSANARNDKNSELPPSHAKSYQDFTYSKKIKLSAQQEVNTRKWE